MLREILVDTVGRLVRLLVIIGGAVLLRMFDPALSKEMALILALVGAIVGGLFEREDGT